MLWTEKYRPKNFDELVGQDTSEIRKLVSKPMSMPNFLFVSRSPGTGKTSSAYVIKRTIKCPNKDFLIMNSSDERKIDSIRGRLKDFVTTRRTKKSVPRLVLLDEIDGMITGSQEALRFLMEKYSSNVRFLLTANREEKVIEAVSSRCTIVRMRDPPKEDIQKRLYYIIGMEKIQISGEAVQKLIEINYPNMRNMINQLQLLSMRESIGVQDVKAITETENEFYGLLKKRNPYETRKFIIQNNLNPRDLCKSLLEITIKDEELKVKSDYRERLKNFAWFTAEIDSRMSYGADSEIQMFALILKWLDIWR